MDKKLWKKYLVGDFSVWRVIRSLIFVYICVLIFALVWSDRMIFQPQTSSYRDGTDIIKIAMADGSTISARFLKNPEAEYTVLYNHANAEDLGDIHEFMIKYRDQGFSVFSYDYPGYGTSPGRPTSGNACRSADAALKHLVEKLGVAPDRIIVHGRSVGGGPALYLARANQVAGVIVESSFVTAFRVMTHIHIAPFDKFWNIARIGKVNCPVLVIHGKDDRIIPFWHGEKLFQKAKEPKMKCWLEGADHNEIPVDAEKVYWEAIADFAELVQSVKQGNRL